MGSNKFLGMALALSLTLPLKAQEKRQVQPEDLVDFRLVSDAQISPDGRRIVFVVTEAADPKQPRKPRDTNIWVVAADGSEPARPFAASPKSDVSPRWSPDGRYLAFLSDRNAPTGSPEDQRDEIQEEPKREIFLLRTDGGEAAQLTDFKGGVEKFEWAPDGNRIAFTVRDPRTEEEEKKRRERDDAVHVDHDYKYLRLWVLGLADHQARPLTQSGWYVSDFTWSPDSTLLAVRFSSTPRLDDIFWHSSLALIDLASDKLVRTISENAGRFSLGADSDVRWSPDGQTIAYPEYTPQKIASWLTLASATGSEQKKKLGREYAETLWGIAWAPDSKHLLAESQVGTRAKLLSLDVTTGSATPLANVLAPGPGFSASRDGRTIAFLNQSPDSPSDVWVMEAGKAPRPLTSLNPQVSAWRLGGVEEITWKNKKDGLTLYGVLITPPGFRPGQSYPTIVQVHGGPQGGWWMGWLGSWHEWGQLLASHGYVVFLPNPRGSTGQGWQFAEANRDDWGGMDFQDIMDGVDLLIEQRIADPNRLGIGGWSYGGFMTSWAVTQTNRFRAAVVGAAVTDLFSFDGTTDITPSFLRNYFLDIPFNRRADYASHSAMTFLQNCKTPSLILHGGADQRVPTSQGWEFYNGLKMLRVPAEMVVYPREPHGFRERAHQIDLLKRVLAWYDRYLKGGS